MEGRLSMILNIAIGAIFITEIPPCWTQALVHYTRPTFPWWFTVLLIFCSLTADNTSYLLPKMIFLQLYRKRNLLLRHFKWCVSCLTVLIIMFTLIILIGFKYLLSSQERSEEKSVLFIKLRNICDRSDRRAFIILEGLICSSYLVSVLKPKCNVCFHFRSVRL